MTDRCGLGQLFQLRAQQHGRGAPGVLRLKPGASVFGLLARNGQRVFRIEQIENRCATHDVLYPFDDHGAILIDKLRAVCAKTPVSFA